jgi:hypothetical protein
MIIKKQHINPLLLTLLFYNKKKNEGGEEITTEGGGLLTEKMGLGAKRKLQKVRKELLTHLETLKEEEQQVRKEYSGETEEDKIKLEAELTALFLEEIKLTSEAVKICEIEKIETEKNYDFELIELITEKCS